jgi:large subunit ribosomal protein L27
MGRDHTLFALTHGAVKFTKKAGGRCYVSILAANDDAQVAMAAE